MLKLIAVLLILSSLGTHAQADDKSFTLNAPATLTETGFLKHLLPRFSLKKGVRVNLVDANADASLSDASQGKPLFQSAGVTWSLDAQDLNDPAIKTFMAWIYSDIGSRTIVAFKPKSGDPFTPALALVVATEEVEYDGDAQEGEKLSLSHCGRCHVVNEKNKMNSLGSTPSFAMLRTLGNWTERFESFFALNPHPSFTQIEEVTEPFDPTRPSPIAPIEMTLDDLEAIVAYVASIAPADLGAPVKAQ